MPYLPEQLGKLVRIQSIKDEYIMEFFWLVEPLKGQYKKHLDEYISHILGHEGEQSLLYMLKRNGMASSISSW